MSGGYTYEHGWEQERIRLAGLELALDPGTRSLLGRLGAVPGARCLEIGAGGGSVAFWLADQVAPGGSVVATDLDTDFLEAEVAGRDGIEVLRHDLMAKDLPDGFDLVHARWLVEWLPDKPLGLERMVRALRPGGVLLIEEPDFVTIYSAGGSAELERVMRAAMAHLQTISPVNCEYGRQALGDLASAGLVDIEAEGRCPIVTGGHPFAAAFLRLTIEKLRSGVLADGDVTESEFDAALDHLVDPGATVVGPMTVAAWGRRP